MHPGKIAVVATAFIALGMVVAVVVLMRHANEAAYTPPSDSSIAVASSDPPLFDKTRMLTLPIEVTSRDFEFEADLERVTYSFRFKHKKGMWFMTIGTEGGVPILADIELRPDVPLIGINRRAGLPNGEFIVVHAPGTNEALSYASLGRGYRVVYAPYAGQ
jgi:hypothetical protein